MLKRTTRGLRRQGAHCARRSGVREARVRMPMASSPNVLVVPPLVYEDGDEDTAKKVEKDLNAVHLWTAARGGRGSRPSRAQCTALCTARRKKQNALHTRAKGISKGGDSSYLVHEERVVEEAREVEEKAHGADDDSRLWRPAGPR